MPSAAPARGIFYGWWIVGVGLLTQMLAVGHTSYGLSVFAKPIAEAFGASRSTVALGFTLLMLVSGVCSPFLGRALDVRPIRGILLVGTACTSLALALMAAAPALWMIGALYAVGIGVGQLAMGPPSASKLAANWFARGRGKAMGISAIGASLGGFFAPPLLQLSIDAFGWRGALLASAIAIAALAIPPIALVVADRPEDKGLLPDGDSRPPPGAAAPAAAAPEASWSVAQLLRDRNFWVIGLGVGAAFSMITGVITGLAPYATDLGHDARSASLLLSALAFSAAVAKPVIGALADRIDKRILLWASVAAFGGAAAILLAHPGYPLLVGGACLLGLAAGGFLPLWTALIGDCYGRASYGQVMGLMSPAMLPFNMFSPWFVHRVFDATGSYDGAFATFAVASLGVAASFLLLRLPKERAR
jgi:MFS family permease